MTTLREIAIKILIVTPPYQAIDTILPDEGMVIVMYVPRSGITAVPMVYRDLAAGPGVVVKPEDYVGAIMSAGMSWANREGIHPRKLQGLIDKYRRERP